MHIAYSLIQIFPFLQYVDSEDNGTWQMSDKCSHEAEHRGGTAKGGICNGRPGMA